MDIGRLDASVYPAVQNFCVAARSLGLGTALTTVIRIHTAEVLADLGRARGPLRDRRPRPRRPPRRQLRGRPAQAGRRRHALGPLGRPPPLTPVVIRAAAVEYLVRASQRGTRSARRWIDRSLRSARTALTAAGPEARRFDRGQRPLSVDVAGEGGDRQRRLDVGDGEDGARRAERAGRRQQPRRADVEPTVEGSSVRSSRDGSPEESLTPATPTSVRRGSSVDVDARRRHRREVVGEHRHGTAGRPDGLGVVGDGIGDARRRQHEDAVRPAGDDLAP